VNRFEITKGNQLIIVLSNHPVRDREKVTNYILERFSNVISGIKSNSCPLVIDGDLIDYLVSKENK
jgi:hypothetical protein